MTWLVWTGIGALVVILLAVSWWYDRDARKRGAKTLSGGQMSRARWAKDAEIARELSQVNNKAMTPKSQDAYRDAWRGKSGPR